MKIKILCFSALSAMVLNVQATEVTSMTFHCTNPHCKYSTIDKNDPIWEEIKKKDQIERKYKEHNDGNVFLSAFTREVDGSPGKETPVSSWHSAVINNYTDHIQRFVVKYDLSVGDDDVYLEKNVNVSPHDSFSEGTKLDLAVIRPSGKYNIISQTLANGDAVEADLFSAPLIIGDGKYCPK